MSVSVLVCAARSRVGVSVLPLYIVSLMLLLRGWRPIRKIPADAENGAINAPGAARRS